MAHEADRLDAAFSRSDVPKLEISGLLAERERGG